MDQRAVPRPVPSLDLLRTFLAVHRSGSMTAAAASLGLAQPTVTAQIRGLEAVLERALFTRMPRGVSPTPAADDLAHRIAGPLDELAGAVAAGGGRPPNQAGGTVFIGGPAEFTSSLVVPALAPLLGRGLAVRARFGLPDQVLDALTQRVTDLAISGKRPRRAGILAEPLCDEEFVLVGAPEWADRLPADTIDRHGPDALLDATVLAYSEDLLIVRRYWRHVFGVPCRRHAALVVPDLRAVLAAVLAGAGISVLPRYLCRAELDSGRLAVLHTPDDPPISTLWLARRPDADAVAHLVTVRTYLLTSASDW